MLKVDLHTHTREDPYDKFFIKYSAKDLIRLAAKQKYDVLSITLHNRVFFNQELKDFAKKRGILLIPGAEPLVQNKDVLLLNVTNHDLGMIKKLSDLEKLKESALIVAPHPFFLTGNCLGNQLIKHIDSFHAIEYSHFYTKAMINPLFKFIAGNARAVETAKEHHKTIIGTSDVHKLYEFGTTFTWVDSPKRTDDVLEAIKKNKVRLDTRPMPVRSFFRRLGGALLQEGLVERIIMRSHMPELQKDLFFKRFKNSQKNKKDNGCTTKAWKSK